ncbi:MAG: hypothetical protein Q8P67_03435, partial [archaeon]|nr:hypothetical protein [archaeon]
MRSTEGEPANSRHIPIATGVSAQSLSPISGSSCKNSANPASSSVSSAPAAFRKALSITANSSSSQSVAIS